MSSNAIKIAAVVLVILALILVFVAYRYGQSLDAQARQQQAQPQQQSSAQQTPTTDVVVAKQPLPAQVKIEKDDVALVPVQIAPKGYLSNVKLAIGRVPMQDIDAGTPLTNRLFAGNNPLARNIPKGTQALSLRVDDVIGTGGFVQPGDHVDVLLYLHNQTAGPNGEYKVQTQARVLLKNALVLTYQSRVMPAPEGMDKKKKDNNNRSSHAHTAVLAVPDADVTRVMLGASLGTLRLALLRQAVPLAAASSSNPATATTTAASASAAAPATVAAASSPAPTTAATLQAMQAAAATPAGARAGTAAAPTTPATASSTESSKVITLKELGFINAQQQQKAQKARGRPQRHYVPRIPIYRGDNKVELARP